MWTLLNASIEVNGAMKSLYNGLGARQGIGILDVFFLGHKIYLTFIKSHKY